MTGVQIYSVILASLLAIELPIAESPVPNARESVNDGLKRRFKERFQETGVSPAAEEDESVAVAAEWLKMMDTAGEGQFGAHTDFFLGFLAGRCRIVPPTWWNEELKSGRSSGAGAAAFPCRRIKERWKGADEIWQFSGFDSVAAAGDKLTLLLQKQQLVLLKADGFENVGLLQNIWSHDHELGIAGSMDRDVCAIVFDCPTYLGGPPAIHCVSPVTGKLLWSRPVFVGNLPGIGLGGDELEGSFSEITIAGDRITVWVGHQFSMCFEIFEKRSGRRLTIFATQYLNGVTAKRNTE